MASIPLKEAVMKTRVRLARIALPVLLVAGLGVSAPLAAQSSDLTVRLDRSTNAADPDDVPDITLSDVAGGFKVTTGPAVVAWDPSNTATGNYTLKGTFTMEEPSGHANYYGLVFGGRELQAASQNYLYFLIAQNGTYIFKHRANDDTVHDIVGRTPNGAIATPDGNGHSVNELEVRVGADNVELVVNGTVVHTEARSGMAGRTDGIWGVRVNHRMPSIVVTGLGSM